MDDDTQLEWSNKLVKAAHLGDSEALRDFLSSGADPNSWGSCGAWVRGAYTFPRTALHVASRQLRLQCLYELLRSGADPHLRDQDGYTAAHYVCQKYIGDEEEGRVAARCLQLLFEFGASCRVITKGGAGLSELARRSGSQRCASLTEAEATTVRPLKELCRFTISANLIYKERLKLLNTLPLPQHLLSYLQFPDVKVEPHAVLQPDPVGDMASFDVQ